ncbi:MAG: GTP 3',8-cyclase MoaA [Nitrospiraceae bacterium]|nr:MAG: GTP 3',8-cyclase MoaA [Nitrospiraceae bacterium]
MKNKTQALKDSFNRRIDYLRVSITDKCNLKCIYCAPGSRPEYFRRGDVLTYEEIVRFVRIARGHGLRKVRITGGEPLLRRNIASLISSLKETGIGDLSLTTNGILLPEIAGRLRDAGLDRVNISLDTLQADRYRSITKGGDIRLVHASIDSAEAAGLSPVKINVVPIRGINDDEIVSFASLTFQKDFHVRFIEFMPASCNGMWSKEKCVTSSEVLKQIRGLGDLELFEFRGRGPSRNYRLKGALGIIGIISPVSDHFCGHCNRLRLTADGKIRPCLFSAEEIDIRTPMRTGVSDKEIDVLFRQAIRIKPQQHLLQEDGDAGRHLKTMSKIGG